MKKIILSIFGLLVLIIAGVLIYVFTSWDRKYDVPEPNIVASTDSAIIERGAYLAYGPAHCATCHVPMDKMEAIESGERLPLTGGWEIAIPPGTFRATNLTPDPETGIGNMTDGQIARALRYGVSHKGSTIMPFMEFQHASDADLQAVISFLRSQPAVKHEVPPTELTFLGKALMAFGMLKPKGPAFSPPRSIAVDSSLAYGEYLAVQIANCKGCHSPRDMMTGEYIGEQFSGGMKFGPDSETKGYVFISPNITPDPESGIMTTWSEETFIQRFRNGKVHKTSPMPWGSFSRMSDSDLKALYRYLMSIDPVKNEVGQIVTEPEGMAMN